MILFLISYSNRLCISLLVYLAEYFLAEMFSCPESPGCRMRPCSLFRGVFSVTFSYSLWTESWLLVLRLFSRVTVLRVEEVTIWTGLSIPNESHLVASLHDRCWAHVSQVFRVSWGMVTAELIGRHFIIGSWWLMQSCPLLIHSFLLLRKYKMSGAYLKYGSCH